MRSLHLTCLAALAVALPGAAKAQTVALRVTVENLAPADSIAFAPLRFGFGNGTFDAFNEGEVAFLLGQPSLPTAPIVTIAEGGSGSTWVPTFASTEPNANLGSVLGPVIPPILPGQTSSTILSVDTDNRFFTFGSMVVPSNDHFIGNEDPQEYEVFDADGNLILGSILQDASEIWDAGSETQNPLNAAFLVVGNNDLRENENQVVRFDFAGLSTFNGLETAAGYIFDSSPLTGDTPVFRISFAVVPEPAGLGLLGACAAGLLARRRR